MEDLIADRYFCKRGSDNLRLSCHNEKHKTVEIHTLEGKTCNLKLNTCCVGILIVRFMETALYGSRFILLLTFGKEDKN